MSQKKNWIETLERELRQLPEEDRLDIVLNYREQITAMLNEGKSEEEILERLGSPKDVAKEAKQALGFESTFDFDRETLFENVKNSANATINQFTEAIDQRTGDTPIFEKLLYLLLLVIFVVVAMAIGGVAIGLIAGGIAIFFVSFLFIHVMWSLFFLCLSIGILLFNTGLALVYGLYKMGRYLVLNIR